MLKRIVIVLLLVFPLCMQAQHKVGFVSYEAVLTSIPDYEASRASLLELKAKYDQEAKRSEEEFQRKFAEFLQGQKDFTPTIMQKRQKELQDLMEKGLAFRQEIYGLLTQAENEMKAELLRKVGEAVRAVGTEEGFSYILNTDDNACPFINPDVVEDVTEKIKARLQSGTSSLPADGVQ